MPKLPVIKDKDLVRALKNLGFIQHRQRGTSHLIMKNLDGKRATIPIHPGKDIPRGTLRAILRDIEISPQKFIKALKK